MYAFAEFRKRTKFVSKGVKICFDLEKACHYFAPFGICNDKTWAKNLRQEGRARTER